MLFIFKVSHQLYLRVQRSNFNESKTMEQIWRREVEMELEGLYDICFSLNLSMPLHSHFNVNVHRTFVKCVSPKSSSIGIRKLDLWRSKFFLAVSETKWIPQRCEFSKTYKVRIDVPTI